MSVAPSFSQSCAASPWTVYSYQRTRGIHAGSTPRRNGRRDDRTGSESHNTQAKDYRVITFDAACARVLVDRSTDLGPETALVHGRGMRHSQSHRSPGRQTRLATIPSTSHARPSAMTSHQIGPGKSPVRRYGTQARHPWKRSGHMRTYRTGDSDKLFGATPPVRSGPHASRASASAPTWYVAIDWLGR